MNDKTRVVCFEHDGQNYTLEATTDVKLNGHGRKHLLTFKADGRIMLPDETVIGTIVQGHNQWLFEFTKANQTHPGPGLKNPGKDDLTHFRIKVSKIFLRWKEVAKTVYSYLE